MNKADFSGVLHSLVFPIAFLLTVKIASAAPVVVGVSPAPNLLTANATSDIVIDFSIPINPPSVSSVTMKVFGHWSGVPQGQIVLENNNQRLRFTPARPFSAGELVTISLAKGIQDTNGQPMAKGYAWTFWIRTSPGSMSLQEIARIPIRQPGEGHIQSYGAYGGDFNGDGFLDLAIPNEISRDVRLFLNDSSGMYSSFSVFDLPQGNTPSPNEGADLNSDGIIDYVVGNAGNDSVTVMIGDGTGGFSSLVSYQATNNVRGVAILDLDGDGHMDIVTASRGGNNICTFRNNGDGTFAPRVTLEAGGNQETACVAADMNNDGILDVVVGTHQSNHMIVLLGDGDGGLTPQPPVPAGGRVWMIACGDVNGDGNVDIVSANSFTNNLTVLLGDGKGGLLPFTAYATGSFPLAIDLGDIDGDGDLDVVTSNYGGRNWTLYENNGNGLFGNPRSLPASMAGSCATLYDRDNDGDLDMTGIDEIDDLVFLFVNPGTVSVEPESGLPSTFVLEQNYPNPFNPNTVIEFGVSSRESISLKVFDVLGREVATLMEGVVEAGIHTVQWEASEFASGVYICRAQSAGSTQSIKVVLLR